MRKATFVMSLLSVVTSTATLLVVVGGAKKVHDETEAMRAKTNETLNKFKTALIDLSV